MDKQFVRRRSEKQARRWQRKLERYRVIQNQINREASDILKSKNFNRMKSYIQHGNMTVNAHVMNVARYSISFCEKLHIPCNKRDLIRGALLHDYFLYDWHVPDKENPHKLHGFYHPGVALRNASLEYELTEREKNIIRRHMWPLTVPGGVDCYNCGQMVLFYGDAAYAQGTRRRGKRAGKRGAERVFPADTGTGCGSEQE